MLIQNLNISTDNILTPGAASAVSATGSPRTNLARKAQYAVRLLYAGRLLTGFIGLLLACGITASTQASPNDIQSIASIRTATADFLELRLRDDGALTEAIGSDNVRVGKLDSRLALTRCEQALTTFLPAGAQLAGKTTVGVRCEGRKPWTVYVPATINVSGTFIASTRSLPRGHILGYDDVEPKEQNLTKIPWGSVTDLEQVIGKELKRPVNAGSALTSAMLGKPEVIKRGQQVTVYSGSGGLQVSVAGTAMASGAEGDRVQIRNTRSKRIIEGTVRADGSVVADPW